MYFISSLRKKIHTHVSVQGSFTLSCGGSFTLSCGANLFFRNICLCIYLGVPDLSCSTQDLLAAACELLIAACGIYSSSLIRDRTLDSLH